MGRGAVKGFSGATLLLFCEGKAGGWADGLGVEEAGGGAGLVPLLRDNETSCKRYKYIKMGHIRYFIFFCGG